jgi:hypothetical protein
MMLYDMPNAPTTETLWTWDQDTAEPVEWRRAQHGGWSPISAPGYGWRDWPDLLAIGPVSDERPDDEPESADLHSEVARLRRQVETLIEEKRQLVVVAEAIGEAGRRRCLPSY